MWVCVWVLVGVCVGVDVRDKQKTFTVTSITYGNFANEITSFRDEFYFSTSQSFSKVVFQHFALFGQNKF